MKQAITAFALVAVAALAACASDDYADSQSGHHKSSRERAFEPKGRFNMSPSSGVDRNEPKGGGAHLQGTPSDVMGGGFGG